ncbi:MAG: hypothetical protein HRT74_00215 [Flavobacteriales bacterium]|nr:hypothetical protein [Flavobacteriales bacterium]
MSRTLLTASFMMLISLCAHSQESENEHQLFFNGSRFINTFLSFNNSTIADGGMQLGYKRYWGNTALRVSMAGNVDFSSSEQNGNSESNSSYFISPRAGVEQRVPLNQRWNFLYGAEFMYVLDQSKVEPTSDFGSGPQRAENKIKDETFGLAPLFGVQFNINNRIALFTETNIVFAITRNVNTQLFTQDVFGIPTESFNKTQIDGFTSSIQVPTQIYFVFRFGK